MTVLTTPQEIEALQAGGRILARVLQAVAAAAKPGVRAVDVDALAERMIVEAGGTPAFKGFHGFPATLCISVNAEVVHGIPGAKVFQEGDIVGLDCGVLYQGLYTDAAVTVAIGKVSKEARRLIAVTEASFWKAQRAIRAGATTGDIGQAVQQYVEAEGFNVVRALVGHGVGRAVHEEPKIPNYGEAGTGTPLVAGLVIAVEPMVTAGKHQVQTAKDGWTVVSADGSLAAHYEHTLLVTEGGNTVITQV